jgi:hypothetical protein
MTDCDEAWGTAIRLAEELGRAENAFAVFPAGMARPMQVGASAQVVRWSVAKSAAFAEISACQQRLDEYLAAHPECFEIKIPNS